MLACTRIIATIKSKELKVTRTGPGQQHLGAESIMGNKLNLMVEAKTINQH